tara:strand:+ start:1526 stop:1792 length:267 start_codon:yes stop_codon:yes gene_type:complete
MAPTKKTSTKPSSGKYGSIPGAGRFAKSTLDKVYKRGLGAYFSSGSRPKTSQHAWAMGRVKSFVTGSGGARKADADLLGKGKSKKKTT